MSRTISGVVIDGVVVPASALPEGARVEIHLQPDAWKFRTLAGQASRGKCHASNGKRF